MSEKEKLKWVESLAQTLVENKLHKLEFETEDTTLVIKARVRAAAPAPAIASPTAPQEDVDEDEVNLIRSKHVGIFRRKADLATGHSITSGQKLGVVEAVSVEHDLLSDCSGVLVEIVVPDGDPVEYGQPIFVVSESEG